jgi:hypothetical protein
MNRGPHFRYKPFFSTATIAVDPYFLVVNENGYDFSSRSVGDYPRTETDIPYVGAHKL